jgi:outer membrane protein
MRHRSALSALALLVGLTTSAVSADADVSALTLDQAQALAVANHPLLQEQRFNAEAALQQIVAARSAYYPQVSAFADRVFAANNTRIAANPGITDPTVIDHGSTGVGVGQLITDFGKTDDTVDRAKLLAKSQEAQTEETKQAVLLDVTRAYFDVLRAQSMLRVSQKNLEDRETILKRVTAMEAARLRSELDVDLARQVVDQANLFNLSADGDRDAAMARLAQALGERTVHNYILADAGPEVDPPPDVDSLVGQMLSGSPELAARAAARDAAYKNADAAEDAGLPAVTAQGYAGYSPIANPSQHLRDSYFAGGISISIPLFTGGLLEANQREAKAQAMAADRAVTDTENRLVSNVRSAYASVRTAYDRIAVTDHLVHTARQSLKLMQTGFELGRNSIVDLSQAELQATEAEISHADARYSYLSKLAALKFIVGQLSAPRTGQ